MSDSGPTPIPAGDGTDGVAAGSVDPDRRFRALMGASAAIIWTAGPGGAATAPQPSWEAYTGQSWPEYAGDGWSAMVHPDDLSRVHRAWADALRTGARVYRTSFRVWHAPSGRYRHVSARSTALRDEHGRIVEWLGTFTDVQDVIAAEQAADRAATISEAMLASAPVGFGWVDTQLRFQYVNPALAAINRRTEAEHLGRTPAELLPLIGERVTELIRRTLAEGPVSGVEFSTPEPDAPGRFRHAVASYFPIRLADPAETIGVGFTVVDVTERTRLREALDAERVRYERLAATDVLAVFGGEGERITEANDAFLSMLGYTRADVAAGRLHWPDLTPAGFEEADERAIKELRTTGRAPAYAKEYRHRDGHPVPVLIGIVALHREPLRWLAYATDLTGERLAQAELRLFQALVERSGDAIAVARADGGMVYVNPAGRQLLGLPAEPGGGQRLTDLGAPEGLIAGALRDGYRRTETRLSRLDTGAEVEVEQQLFTVSTGPEADATGYLATVSRDIGERQRTLRRAEALARFAGELSRAQGPEEILRAMAGQVGPVFAARDVRIAVAEPGRPALRVLRFVERAGGDSGTSRWTSTPTCRWPPRSGRTGCCRWRVPVRRPRLPHPTRRRPT
ncbi:PAS domain-containing protein [Plantactinospora sp. KBS50]|uniref:PAS domain-containing protein n=1 Tax=Plantactinospora sp. KBS50 TaxID=2024580 RepID=UPI000BAAB708|nr:PAS domain S-box protein [Plantactinospora sp. KBS50]ASW55242.1 hypothetical protein CIK06_15255 [Plantactinospora sp. KBS50]